MNKKLNTAIFFVVATAVNIALVLILALVLLVLYGLLQSAVKLPPMVSMIALVVIVIGSMAGSFPIYRALVNLFQKKVDMEKYFEPIALNLGRKNRRR